MLLLVPGCSLSSSDDSLKKACALVEDSYKDFDKTAGLYLQQAATREEMTSTLKIAADKFEEASVNVEEQYKDQFSQASLSLNQLRVAVETKRYMSDESSKNYSAALNQYLTLCDQ